MKKVSIVGCLPSPVGGVSVFCERLSGLVIDDSCVQLDFYDIYKGEKTFSFPCDANFKFKKPKFSNAFYAQIWLFWVLVRNKPTTLLLNFSRENSLFFVALLNLFLRNTKLYVCLHHGNLNVKNSLFKFVFKSALKNVSKVFSLSPNQYKFYKQYLTKDKIVSTSSYLPPLDRSGALLVEKSLFKILISGNNAPHYNVATTLRSVLRISAEHPFNSYVITISIYGNKSQSLEDELTQIISNVRGSSIKVNITHDLTSVQFNQLLKTQDLYIRNTSVDSFGILVADAVNFGVKVLASDVCPRYCGAYVFKYEHPTSFEGSFIDILNNNEKELNCSKAEKVHFPYKLLMESLGE